LVDEGCSDVLVDDSPDEVSAGELVGSGATVPVEEALSDELSVAEVLPDEASVDDSLSDVLSLAVLLSDEASVVELLSDELSLVEPLSLDDDGSGLGVELVNGGVAIIVLVITIVVTLGSLDDSTSESELVCLLLVSGDELGGKVSGDVMVPLANCRLTWRGK